MIVKLKNVVRVLFSLIEMTDILGTTKEEIAKSLQNDFSDYEDSIQYSTALNIKDLNAIITRNVNDFRNSSIAVLTPLSFLSMLRIN